MGAYGHNKNGANFSSDAGSCKNLSVYTVWLSSWTLYGDIEGHGASDYDGEAVLIF